MAQNCDACGKDIKPSERVDVRNRRPSDPTDHCCIMWGCADCFPPTVLKEMTNSSPLPSMMFASEWDEWVEMYGADHGVWFLT